MPSFSVFSILLLAAQSVTAAAVKRDVGDTELVTTSLITTLTIADACYTKTVLTPDYGPDCPTLQCKGPIPQCIAIRTKTIPAPPIDPLCPSTPTATLAGACATCHTGCATSTSTIWLPLSTPLPESQPTPQIKPAAACSTTIWRSATAQRGQTFTYHPLTETSTSLVDCKGCNLVVSEMQGVGPVISRSVTITDLRPATSTTYACQ
ncbi:hypothetical protein GLAREA_10949 [Glarea lozoyensis ATCC 20868]|uniref:Uncharacterized protein n=1 Tax=Glarea lozoyensis (strain ATCC 20868 / MF5171) TaxID=1116229 RepID=S3D9W7_GLAL2|nr:uncharacterized protein GLAREA_10949 [Glarea lozoyensis ATCC 20868]EPE35252.1 hypothetical protein GLAREA_10949 [Glarea lozoyensis ATCC 20868]